MFCEIQVFYWSQHYPNKLPNSGWNTERKNKLPKYYKLLYTTWDIHQADKLKNLYYTLQRNTFI